MDAPATLGHGRYSLLNPEALGKGAFGGVWEYRDEWASRVVAIKLIYRAADRTPLEEGRQAAKFQHDNIVVIHDVLEEALEPDQTVAPRAIVMERLTGPSLARLLTSGRASEAPRHAMDWIEQVCRALAHAHHWHYGDGRPAGVIHGDLHLGNVILHDDDTQSRPKVKVTDWGMSQDVGAATRGFGDIFVMAPEAVDGNLEPASDLWAAGLMLAQLASGRLLPRETDQGGRALALRTRDSALELAAGIPSKATRELIGKLLEEETENRATTAQVRKAVTEYRDELRAADDERRRLLRDRERAEREAREREAREHEAREHEAQEREAQEREAREAQELRAREQAEREAREHEARERHRRSRRRARARTLRRVLPLLGCAALLAVAAVAGLIVPLRPKHTTLPPSTVALNASHLRLVLGPGWTHPAAAAANEGVAHGLSSTLATTPGAHIVVGTIRPSAQVRDPLDGPLRAPDMHPQPFTIDGLPVIKYEGRDHGLRRYGYVALFVDGDEVVMCSAESSDGLGACRRALATLSHVGPALSPVIDGGLQAAAVKALASVSDARSRQRPTLTSTHVRLKDRRPGLAALAASYANAAKAINRLEPSPLDREPVRALADALGAEASAWSKLAAAAKQESRVKYNARRTRTRTAERKVQAAIHRLAVAGYVRLVTASKDKIRTA